jgi:uncharacterized protein YbgA (DUF1722 family)
LPKQVTLCLVDKLLKNLVTRNVCWKTEENRSKITQKGLEVLTKLDPKVIEHENYFSNNLNTEELEQLNTLLEKYRNQQIQ